jgi:hypothetical protein
VFAAKLLIEWGKDRTELRSCIARALLPHHLEPGLSAMTFANLGEWGRTEESIRDLAAPDFLKAAKNPAFDVAALTALGKWGSINVKNRHEFLPTFLDALKTERHYELALKHVGTWGLVDAETRSKSVATLIDALKSSSKQESATNWLSTWASRDEKLRPKIAEPIAELATMNNKNPKWLLDAMIECGPDTVNLLKAKKASGYLALEQLEKYLINDGSRPFTNHDEGAKLQRLGVLKAYAPPSRQSFKELMGLRPSLSEPALDMIAELFDDLDPKALSAQEQTAYARMMHDCIKPDRPTGIWFYKFGPKGQARLKKNIERFGLIPEPPVAFEISLLTHPRGVDGKQCLNNLHRLLCTGSAADKKQAAADAKKLPAKQRQAAIDALFDLGVETRVYAKQIAEALQDP